MARFVVDRHHIPFAAVTVGDATHVDPEQSGLTLVDADGRRHAAQVETIVLERNGAQRGTVAITGVIGSNRSRLAFVARLTFFAGLATVRFELMLRNPRRAEHRGGFWELGDSGSALVKDVSLSIAVPAAGLSTFRCSPECGVSAETFHLPFTLYQDSSGGERWQGTTHRNAKGDVPTTFRGYTIAASDVRRSGERATPIAQLTRGDASATIAVEHFWQNFPKAIAATDSALTLRLFPGAFGDLHEIQGGEQKTHAFFVGFGADPVSDPPFEWCRTPSRFAVDACYVAATGAIPFLTARESAPAPEYDALVDHAISGDDSFVAKRERVDEYGWRDFGEVYADHEAVFAPPDPPLVSHYNNQYDAVAGSAYQWLRSGNPEWWRLMDDLARHVVDIDIYHTDEDWAKYNHGLFWHTVHYKDAGLSTHRTYPRVAGVHGGGPSAGHLYTTGLALHYFLTGSVASRDAAIELATFIIDSDDGTKSIFKWLDRGPTGYATASGTADYHGPGRAPGNSLNALIDGHLLTGDARFLRKAEEIIRRVIHPADDIAARNLLDAENKWFYTMFLQSLGKFLMHKEAIGEIDAAYAYAQASLLAYARWMADHEYPILDKPEILEYPTETWAAQDMRKSEVFKWAALHAEPTLASRFLERAKFFYDYSVRTLTAMPTRTLARPTILLMAYGWNQAAFAAGPPRVAAPAPGGLDFGRPSSFVPQKARAMRRAKMIVAGGAAIAAVVVAAGLFYLLR